MYIATIKYYKLQVYPTNNLLVFSSMHFFLRLCVCEVFDSLHCIFFLPKKLLHVEMIKFIF